MLQPCSHVAIKPYLAVAKQAYGQTAIKRETSTYTECGSNCHGKLSRRFSCTSREWKVFGLVFVSRVSFYRRVRLRPIAKDPCLQLKSPRLLAAQVKQCSVVPSTALLAIMSLSCRLTRETCIYGMRARQTFPMSSFVEAADRRSMFNKVTSDILKCSTETVMADQFCTSANCIA